MQIVFYITFNFFGYHHSELFDLTIFSHNPLLWNIRGTNCSELLHVKLQDSTSFANHVWLACLCLKTAFFMKLQINILNSKDNLPQTLTSLMKSSHSLFSIPLQIHLKIYSRLFGQYCKILKNVIYCQRNFY